MPAVPALLALLLQLAFALLPGDGWVLCLGGGAGGSADHAHAHDGPCRCADPGLPRDGSAPVHRPADADGDDCQGVHLQRADGEEWASSSPDVRPPARHLPPCALPAPSGDGPAPADRERAAARRTATRGSPPPPRSALVELGTVRIQR